MEWINKRPEATGFYWCFQRGRIRMVNLWEYINPDGRIFTNEDGGVIIQDPMYDDALWQGPIIPPKPPKETE